MQTAYWHVKESVKRMSQGQRQNKDVVDCYTGGPQGTNEPLSIHAPV